MLFPPLSNHDAHLGHVEFQGAMIKPLFPQDRRKLPGTMDMVRSSGSAGFPLQNGQRLPIGQPGHAPNYRCRESIIFDSVRPDRSLQKRSWSGGPHLAASCKLHVRQSLRQHRQYAIWKINAISSAHRFTIEGRARFHVMGNIRDMNPDSPPAIVRHHMYGIIKVTRIVRVDREYRSRSEVLARAQFLVRYLERNLFRFFQNHFREHDRKIILSNDRENIDARLLCRAENFNDLPFGIEVPMLPGFQPDNYLVVDLRRSRELPSLHGDINIVNKSRFVRHNVIKILRTLKRPDDGLVRFNQNLDYSSLSIGPTSTAALRSHRPEQSSLLLDPDASPSPGSLQRYKDLQGRLQIRSKDSRTLAD